MANHTGIVGDLSVISIRAWCQTGVFEVEIVDSRHISALLAGSWIIHTQNASLVAKSAGVVNKKGILPVHAGGNTPVRRYLLEVADVGGWVGLATLAVEQIPRLARTASPRALLAHLRWDVGVVGGGAGQNATVGGSVEIVVQWAFVDFCAVGWGFETSSALRRTHLTDVGVPCPSVLTHRTFKRTNCVSDVEVITENVGWVGRISRIFATLALKKRWACTNLTAWLARLASTVRCPLITSLTASLHTDIILQVQPHPQTGYWAASAVSGSHLASIAIYIAKVAFKLNIDAVLPDRTRTVAVGSAVNQIINHWIWCFTWCTRERIPWETLCTTLPASHAGIVCNKAVVSWVAAHHTLSQVEIVVCCSAHIGARLAVARVGNTGETRAIAKLTGQGQQFPILTVRAHSSTNSCVFLQIVGSSIVNSALGASTQQIIETKLASRLALSASWCGIVGVEVIRTSCQATAVGWVVIVAGIADLIGAES